MKTKYLLILGIAVISACNSEQMEEEEPKCDCVYFTTTNTPSTNFEWVKSPEVVWDRDCETRQYGYNDYVDADGLHWISTQEIVCK